MDTFGTPHSKCPLNNTNYWTSATNITVYSPSGKKRELSDGKIHINKVR